MQFPTHFGDIFSRGVAAGDAALHAQVAALHGGGESALHDGGESETMLHEEETLNSGGVTPVTSTKLKSLQTLSKTSPSNSLEEVLLFDVHEVSLDPRARHAFSFA